MEREQTLATARSEYDDLTNKLRASDERRVQIERALEPMRRASPNSSSGAGCLAGQCPVRQQLAEAGPTWRRWRSPSPRAMCACTACRPKFDRLHREIAALGAVNLAALEELQLATRAQNLFGCPRCRT